MSGGLKPVEWIGSSERTCKAAKFLDVKTADLKDILRGSFEDYSLPWLLEKLFKLGLRAELTISHPDRALDRGSETTAPYDDATD